MFSLLRFSFLIILLVSIPFAVLEAKYAKQEVFTGSPVYDYQRGDHIPLEVWEHVKPYLLPSNHPLKAKLDKLFSSGRIILTQKTLEEAGFDNVRIRASSQTIVSTHPEIPGFLVKLFTDKQEIQEHLPLVHRIEGAQIIQREIQARRYEKMFKVPKKWIYPLPNEPSPPPEYHRKNFILVVEDMHIFRKRKNYKLWREKITAKRADAIFVLLQVLGLNDSIYPFNLPFCADGRQAFIDTEHYHQWPVCFEVMLQFFSHDMELYWRTLIGQGGPK